MKNIQIKSVLLGMGIGIVLSAIIGFIFALGYTAGTPVPSAMTKDQIISEAKKYGMVENSIFKEGTTDSSQTNNENSTGGN